jgi:acylphosphatase
MERRRVSYTGRVQGVGFRATARDIASQHPVTGWVRNEPDGTVTLEVQGIPPDVESYLDEVRSRMGRAIRGEQATVARPVSGESAFVIAR